MPEHMGVNGVDLGGLNIKGLGGLLDDKVDAADGHLALADHMRDLVHRAVENLAERTGELIDQRLAAAVFRTRRVWNIP